MKLRSVKPGKKAANASRAEFVLAPTFNKFSINALLSELLELEHGQSISIHEDEDVDTMEGRFYISVGVGDNIAKLASATKSAGVGHTLSFNYSGLYSRMLQEDPNAHELSAKDLAEKGLVQERETKAGNKSYTALKTLSFGVGEPTTIDAVNVGGTEGEELEIYPLVEMKVSEYTPKTVDVSDDIPEEQED